MDYNVVCTRCGKTIGMSEEESVTAVCTSCYYREKIKEKEEKSK